MRYNIRDKKGRFIKKDSTIRKEGEYWVDQNDNKWDIKYYSEKEVEKYSASLLDCSYCINCIYCVRCRGCNGCSYCNHCIDCSYCNTCNGCEYCSNCYYCGDCVYCTDCSLCNDCDSFSKDPERIIGPKMGSRNDNPVVYWTKAGEEQCIVGCFRGTLNELEEAVEETHKDNPVYLTQYRKFIRCVRLCQKGME